MFFTLWLIPSVVAFSWFVSTRVAFTVGISNVLWVVLGGTLLSMGLSLSQAAGGQAVGMMSFGAFLGVVVMVGYIGRNHYWSVIRQTVGLRGATPTPAYCIWAARGLLLLIVVATWWLSAAGLAWSLALVFVLVMMLIYLVLARINVETGLLFAQTAFAPMTVVLAWAGFEAVGPTAMIVLALAGTMMMSDPRQVISGFVANALRLVDRGEQAGRRTGISLIGVMIAASLVLALLAALFTQYAVGFDRTDWVAVQMQPAMPFHQAADELAEASATGALSQANMQAGAGWLGHIDPTWSVAAFTLVGLALVIGCAFAALRLPWWPIHPVLFLIWGTLPSMFFGWSFLAGWAIKQATLNFTGPRGFNALKPLMVGVIAGEAAMAVLWLLVGGTYYFISGGFPPAYAIFP